MITKADCRPSCPLALKRGRYCSNCPSKDAKVKLWSKTYTPSGKVLLAIAAGDFNLIKKVAHPPIHVVDLRPNVPMRSKLKWTGKLRDGRIDAKGRETSNQKKMLHDWINATRNETGGIITSTPRSGKTVLGVAAVIATRLRSFITASKIDFLRQFGRRFGELTNLRELYRQGQRPVVLVDPKGWSDGVSCGVHVIKKWDASVDRADVVLFAYQQLLDTTGGRARIKRYVDGKFGLGIGDEIHLCGAPCFSKMFNRVNVRRRLGLTATPARKDGLWPVSTAVMGRVVSVGRVASDLPEMQLLETGVGSAREYKFWPSMVKYITESDERNKIILRQIFKDLRTNPHHCVLVPTTRRNHIHTLVKMINGQAEYCRKEKGENWPSELAVAYYGKSDTNAVLNQVSAGRARVTVAMVSMTQYGLDIARWTHVYIGITPTSNTPNVYQLLNRVCTPYPLNVAKKLGEKPQAVVRFFIDEMSASVFCFKRLFDDPEYGIKVSLTGQNYYGVKLARANTKTLDRMTAIAKFPRSYSSADVGIKIELGKTKTGRQRRKSAWSTSHTGITRL